MLLLLVPGLFAGFVEEVPLLVFIPEVGCCCCCCCCFQADEDDGDVDDPVVRSAKLPSLTKCILLRWCLYAPLDMKCVSQKAHFINESDAVASLQAQLNARIEPGVAGRLGLDR